MNSKLQGRPLKKEDIVIPFVSTHYSNFDLKIISNIDNTLLNNVIDNKLKEVFDKCKVFYMLEIPKNLLLLSLLTFLKSVYYIAMNVKIPAVIYANHIHKNVQVS